MLDWIFLISSLNFSFWSEKEGRPDRYGVEWLCSWESEETKIWTGYWSLVAALNRGKFIYRPVYFNVYRYVFIISSLNYSSRGGYPNNRPSILLVGNTLPRQPH